MAAIGHQREGVELRSPEVSNRRTRRSTPHFSTNGLTVAAGHDGSGVSRAIFTSSAFERRFRDIHTVTQQLQGRQAHLETVGRYLLGLEPDQTFL